MSPTSIILSVVGLSAALGAAAVFFKRGSGMETINLLQTNIKAYQDAEKLKDETIVSLKAEIRTKDRVIERLTNDGKSKRSSR